MHTKTSRTAEKKNKTQVIPWKNDKGGGEKPLLLSVRRFSSQRPKEIPFQLANIFLLTSQTQKKISFSSQIFFTHITHSGREHCLGQHAGGIQHQAPCWQTHCKGECVRVWVHLSFFHSSSLSLSLSLSLCLSLSVSLSLCLSLSLSLSLSLARSFFLDYLSFISFIFILFSNSFACDLPQFIVNIFSNKTNFFFSVLLSLRFPNSTARFWTIWKKAFCMKSTCLTTSLDWCTACVRRTSQFAGWCCTPTPL